MIFLRKLRRPDVIVWRAPGAPATGVDYARALVELVSAAGYTPHVLDYFNEPPDRAVLACRRHLLTGGEVAVSDPSPANTTALQRIGEVYRRAMQRRLRLAGICLGSQQIAALHAGPDMVQGSSTGFHIGFGAMRSEVPHFPPVTAFQFHYEEVVSAFLSAPGVSRLYSSDGTPVEGYRIGSHIAAMQFHPEFDPELGQAVLASNGALMDRFNIPAQEAVERSAMLADQWALSHAVRLVKRLLA